MKRTILITGVILTFLLVANVLAYNINVQDNCSIGLTYDNNSIITNVSLICLNRTITIPDINYSAFNNSNNYSNSTNITYINQTLNITIANGNFNYNGTAQHIYVNITNGSFISNNYTNITQNTTYYIYNGSGYSNNSVYTKEQIDSLLSPYAKISQIPAVQNSNLTSRVTNLESQNNQTGLLWIVMIIVAIIALAGVVLAVKNQMNG